MSARFIDEHVSREGPYSLGRDLNASGYYISISVSNSLVDYKEYYNIMAQNFADYLRKPSMAMTFADDAGVAFMMIALSCCRALTVERRFSPCCRCV